MTKTDKTGSRHPGAPEDATFRASAQWPKLRMFHLTRNPLCAVCGRVGSVVHHVEIPSGRRDLFFAAANLATLCRRHHDQVHAAYQRGLTWRDITGS